jgi:hypothetical protein
MIVLTVKIVLDLFMISGIPYIGMVGLVCWLPSGWNLVS